MKSMEKCIKIFPERKNTMLGKTVYFLDFRDNGSVKEGIVYDVHVTSSGYPAYQLLVGKEFTQRETVLCFLDKENAEKELNKLKPLADRITDFAKNSQDVIDGMRKELLGEPTLLHLKGQ